MQKQTFGQLQLKVAMSNLKETKTSQYINGRRFPKALNKPHECIECTLCGITPNEMEYACNNPECPQK